MSYFKTIGLTGLRGLACINVIIFHINQHRSIDNLGWWDWNIYQYTEALAISVSFFFIMSGLYQSLPYWKTIYLDDPMPDAKKNIIERFWRLSPAYYSALIVSFFLAMAVGLSTSDTIIRLFSGLTFLSWIHPYTIFPVDINGPLWYVPFDMVGGLIVIGIMILLTKIPRKYIPIGLALSAACLLALHFLFIKIPFPPGDGVAYTRFPIFNPFLFGLHFLTGVVLGWIYIVGEKKQRAKSIKYDILAIISFVSILLFLWHIREAEDFAYSWPTGPYRFPIISTVLAIGMFGLQYSAYIGKWLDNTILSRVAKISYGVYLWQAIFIVLIHKYLFPGYEDLPMEQWVILLVSAIILSFGMGWVSYTYLETGIYNWRKKRAMKMGDK